MGNVNGSRPPAWFSDWGEKPFTWFYRWDEFIAERWIAPILANYMSANWLTLCTLILAFAGAFLLSMEMLWAGVILYCAGRFLDHADGRIATINVTEGPFGQWWDLMVDALSSPVLYVAIGISYGLDPVVFCACALIAFMVRCQEFSYIYADSLQELEESNVLGHMAYDESGGLYYWLIPLFALSGSLDYFIYLSTAGHILWITFVIYKTFKAKSAAQKHPTETTVQEEKSTLEWLYRFDEFVAEDYVAPFLAKYMSANWLTFYTLVLAISGAFLGSIGLWGIGVALFCIGRFLDHADGQIARLTKTAGPLGHLWDLVAGALSFLALYIAIGISQGLEPTIVTVCALIAFLARWQEYAFPGSLHDLEESGFVNHMAYCEDGGLYYWLIPLFAMAGSLDYFMYLSTAGHVLWTAYIMWKSYRYRCEACIAPITQDALDSRQV